MQKTKQNTYHINIKHIQSSYIENDQFFLFAYGREELIYTWIFSEFKKNNQTLVWLMLIIWN